MAQNRGGLSYESEEEEVVEDQPAREPGLGVMVGSGKSAMLASPSTLEAMANLYNQRMEKQNSFMEALKDAAAWTGGGIYGPTETLKMRDEQRSRQASELFSMQNQIAQHKQAMQLADAFLGKTQPTAAAQGEVTPGTATDQAAPAAGGRTGGLLDMVKDPNLKRQIGAQYLSDPKAAMGQLNKYLMETGQTGELARFENWMVSNGFDPEQVRSSVYLKGVGPGAFEQKDVRTAAGTVGQTPLQAAKDVIPKTGVAPGTPAAAAIRNPAPPQTAPAQGAAPQAGAAPAPRAPGMTAPAAAPRAPAAPAAPAAPTPTAAGAAVGAGGFAPGTKEDLALRQRVGEARIEGVAAEAKERGKELGMNENVLDTAGKTSTVRLASIQNVGNIIDRHTKAAGPLSKPGMLPAILTVVQDGISAGNFGQVGMPGIEKAVRQLGGGQAEIDAAQELGREFAKMQLANSQSYLKGQGAVSDAERRLIAEMSGRTGDSPAAIRRFMQWEKKAAEYDRDLHKDYITWKRANRGASFEDFKLLPSYMEKSEKYSKDLLDLANQPLAAAAKPGAQRNIESHPGRALLDKYPKR